MQINKVNNTTFHSGLTSKILLEEKFVNTSRQEKFFTNNFGIIADFKNNKSCALANRYCANIFNNLAKLLNKNFTLPPFIILYNQNHIIDKKAAQNFCIPDTKEVLDNDDSFPGRSIFFANFHNLKYIDNIVEQQYKNKQTSSSHFLAPFIHEWLHSIQLDSIYKKFGYGGNCSYLNKRYPKQNTTITGYHLIKNLEHKTISKQENEIVFDILGEYATLPENQYLEIFSEAFTKFICSSLDGVNLKRNPIDLLKKTPKEFQILLEKICNFQYFFHTQIPI